MTYSFRFSDASVTKIQALIFFIESPKNMEPLNGSKSLIWIPMSYAQGFVTNGNRFGLEKNPIDTVHSLGLWSELDSYFCKKKNCR